MDPERLSEAEIEQIATNGHSLLSLYRSHHGAIDLRKGSGEVFVQGCLARTAYSLDTILSIRGRGPDIAALARSLYEHALAVAWLMIDVAQHYPMFLRWEYDERMKMCKDIEAFGVEPDRDEIRRSLLEMGQVPAPPSAVRAQQADGFWSRCIADWEFGFRREYANLFRPYSVYTHPTVMGVFPFITPGQLTPFDGKRVQAAAVASFADALVVTSWRWGVPPMRAVAEAYTAGLVG